MKINNIENSTNFKQIKLSRKDALKTGRLILEHRKCPNPQRNHNLLLDIFLPYIEKEADLIDNTIFSVKDFKQDLCISLIEKFDKLKEKNHPVSALVQQLNSVRPDESAKITISDSLLDDLSETEKKVVAYKSAHEKPLILKIKDLISTTNSLSEREKGILDKYLDCRTNDEISKSYGMTTERIRQILKKSIHKIKLKHNKKYRIEYEKLHPQKVEAE